jgi:hypothetical protein
MTTPAFARVASLAAAIAFGAMIVGAPSAHASEKSNCEGKGGTYTQTDVTWNGKPSTVHRCCVKDTATNSTSCTSTTVTKATLHPLEPTRPTHRIPVGVLTPLDHV